MDGSIRQPQKYMPLLEKAHLGEASVTVWPKILKNMYRKKNIHILK
jgi:aspartate--ammonia ligase